MPQPRAHTCARALTCTHQTVAAGKTIPAGTSRCTGVYLGYALVRGAVHKAVANVGVSPTFGDAAAPEVTVETHVMAEFADDFYGERIKLLLLGRTRAEKKFGGLEELVATIRNDVASAAAELDESPLLELRSAPWLHQSPPANAAATYELLDPSELLDEALAAVAGKE